MPITVLLYSDGLLDITPHRIGLSATAVNNVCCCILTEEPHNSNRDSAYTDSFPIFVEGLDMVTLSAFATIDNMTWGGWGGKLGCVNVEF